MSMIWKAFALTPDEVRTLESEHDPFAALRELPDDRVTGLYKAWDAAHWLLTGGTDAVTGSDGFIKSGGSEIETLDAGYGPAQYFSPRQVAAIREVLRALPREKLASRWDSEAIQADQVYPFFDNVDEDSAARVLDRVDEVRAFIDRMPANQGLLVYIG